MAKNNQTTLSIKELAKLMDKHTDRLLQVVSDYQVAMQALDVAVRKFENYQKNWWVLYKKPIFVCGIILIALLLYVVVYAMTPSCQLTLSLFDVQLVVNKTTCH